MSKPNVILLTIDTLRADRLGCYGHTGGLTPNLDRLAEKGVRFERAITGGSWTQAAFPTLLTSSYASMYGGCLGPLSPERPSPIEALATDGYATGGFVTSPLLSQTYGYHRGFRHFVDLIPEERKTVLQNIKGGQRLLRNPLTHYVSNLLGQQTRPSRVYLTAAKVNDAVYEWLDGVQDPFFAWVHYMDVHWPYHIEDKLEQPKDIAQAWQDLSHLHAVNWQGANITPNQRDYYIELYEQAVHYTDTQVGQLLDYLENSSHADNTIVVVVSDHGEEFLERQYWGHVETNLYDEIVRVPLIIGLPSLVSGKVVDRQVRTLDIMPTVLDLCDCSLPDGVEGTSLVPLWSGGEDHYNGTVAISERWRNIGDVSHIIAVRTDSFKYIWDINQPHQPKLYNLQTDPDEKHDVLEQFPEKAQELQAYVDEHLRRAEQTTPDSDVSEPELDEEVVSRLRDLGYIE